MSELECAIDGCAGKVGTRTWCRKHYTRWQRHGDPLVTKNPNWCKGTAEQRFWAKVDKSGDCWLWTGAISHNGYGRFKFNGKMFQAHRLAYELEIGPIKDGLTLDHLCRTRSCVYPMHLEQTTIRDNVLRGTGITAMSAQKTHCKNGHPFNEENTYRWSKRPTMRTCKACSRESYLRNRDTILANAKVHYQLKRVAL